MLRVMAVPLLSGSLHTEQPSLDNLSCDFGLLCDVEFNSKWTPYHNFPVVSLVIDRKSILPLCLLCCNLRDLLFLYDLQEWGPTVISGRYVVDSTHAAILVLIPSDSSVLCII